MIPLLEAEREAGMTTLSVPAREGRAFEVARGGRFRIVTPEGQQAADFFAYNARAVGEWLSANHTWIKNRRVKLRDGDEFQSRYRRPLLRLTEDGADGVHDLMIPACDQIRYEQLGHQGPHASCSENLAVAMRRLGHAIDVVPPAGQLLHQHGGRGRRRLQLAAQPGRRLAPSSSSRR